MSIEFLHVVDGEDKSCSFKNRLRKNYKHTRKWARRTESSCFRLYDREISEFPLAVDYYEGRFCVHYFSRRRGEDEPPQPLVDHTVQVLKSLFGVGEELIFWRSRIKREKRQQYEKRGSGGEIFTAHEYGVKFEINLVDYLDTGLFLDHRETRQLVAKACRGKTLLNLFSYTCSFSVHAAVQGSTFTKSVDMSNTYTEWGRRNFKLNGLAAETNEVVRADCLRFLDLEIRSGRKYDVIVIDPPTLSRSKKMSGMFDIQEDYLFLLSRGLQLLNDGGVIFFSTNSRKFEFDPDPLGKVVVQEISDKTVPNDFHDPKIHRCWKISAEARSA
jgi:23S rRNA (cytosine1962-C5)-methyltransferase